MKKPYLLILGFTLLLLLSGTVSSWATNYTFSFFDYPGGTPSDPMSTSLYGINDSGQLVGSYQNSEIWGYFIYSGKNNGGAFTTIDNLPDMPRGFSNSGLIAGFYFDPDTGGWLGYMRSPTTGVVSTFSAPGSTYTVVTGVNNLDQVCGYYWNAEMTATHWFTYDGTNFTTLTDFPNSDGGYSHGPNVHGQLAGSYQDTNNNSVCVIGPQGGPFTTLQTPTAAVPNMHLDGINDNGQVLGDATLGGVNQVSAFISTGDDYTILPAPDPNGASRTETVPYAINNSGEVVGIYWDTDGSYRGFIYSTPIPPGLFLFGSGLLGLLAWRRFRKS